MSLFEQIFNCLRLLITKNKDNFLLFVLKYFQTVVDDRVLSINNSLHDKLVNLFDKLFLEVIEIGAILRELADLGSHID